jgi:hypothetical protein
MKHRNSILTTTILVLLVLLLGLVGIEGASQPAERDDMRGPIDVVLSWEGQPGLHSTLTLTARVTPQIDADRLTLHWVLPAGVTLDGAALEDLGPAAAGQSFTRQRQVTFEQAGEFKLAVGAQMAMVSPEARWGASDVLYVSIAPEARSTISRQGPRLASTEEHIQAEVTYSPAVHPDGGYDVYGRFMYWDIPISATAGALTPTLVPARQVLIKVMEYDPIWDDYEGSTRTDDDGYFSFHISNNDDGLFGGDKETYLKIYPNTPGAYVTDRSGIDEDYVVVTNDHSGGSDINFGTLWPNSFSPMFNIADVALDGYRYAMQYRSSVKKVQVQYEPGYGEDGSFWSRYWEEIAIADAGGDDAYDDTVILHEYGHFLAQNYSCDESEGGDHNAYKHYSEELAYSEGWANYFSSAVRDNSRYLDWNYDTNTWSANLDWETWNVTGKTNEGAVAAAMWDIHDPANETHDRLEAGGDEIWDVFDDYMEVQPGVGFYWECSIDMFFFQWGYAGYGSDSDVAAIFGQYAISNTIGSAAAWYGSHAGEIAAEAAAAPPFGTNSSGTQALFEDETPWEGVLFLVDATQSMDMEIDAIKTVIQDRVTSMEAEPEAVQFIVETFNDTDANTLVVDDFWPDIVNPAVAGITVGGGGDVAEDTMEALGRGTHFRHGYNAWLFTDAPPHEPQRGKQEAGQGITSLTDWVGSTVAMLQRRKVTPYIFIFGDCADENLGAEPSKAPGVDSFQQCIETYLASAEGTGGQFMFLDTSEVADATEIVRALMTDNAMAGRFSHSVSSSNWQYEWDDVEYDWFDASFGTFYQIGDTPVQVPLPWFFTYYGQTYNTLYVGRPGYVSFANSTAVDANTAIPTAALPNNAVYAFWDALDSRPNLGAAGGDATMGVYTYYDAPDRFVIEYYDNYHTDNPTTGYETFQIVLRRNYGDDEILFQYEEVFDDSSATIGVENANGTVATQVAFDEAGFLYPGRALQFTPVPPGPRDHEVLVDSTMASVSFFLNGYKGTVNMTVYRPGGTPVNPNDPDVTYIDVSQARYYRIDNPAAGTYTATVSGDGTYYFASSSESTLDADVVGDHTLTMGPTTILLDLGIPLTVQPTFGLVDRRGVLVDTLMLYDDGAHGDGLAGDGLYGGSYTPAMPGSFYLQVEGQTPAGEPFRRLDLVPLTFQRLQMWIGDVEPDTRFAQPGGLEQYTFVIQNWSNFTYTLDLYLDSTQGWAVTSFYTRTIPAGAWRIVPVTVWVPAGANGLVDETTLSVYGAGMAADYVATTIVRGPVADVAVEAQPPEIYTTGYTSTIIAYVEDDQHWAVADGTEVLFETSLGTIAPVTATTVDGVATATLASGATPGTAIVRATADSAASDTVRVEVISPRATTLTLSVADSTLLPNGISTTVVTAHVYDEYGQPARNGTLVVFGVEGDEMIMGTVEGVEVYTATTTSGVASVTYQVGTVAGLATVRAEIWRSAPPLGGEGTDNGISARAHIWLGSDAYRVYLPLVRR